METLIIFIFILVISIVCVAINDANRSKGVKSVIGSLILEGIAFTGGWITTIAVVSFRIKMIGLSNYRGEWGPIHMALRYGQPNIAIKLIREGADVELIHELGWRTIHFAAYYGYIDVVEKLLEAPKGNFKLRKHLLYSAKCLKHRGGAWSDLSYSARPQLDDPRPSYPVHSSAPSGSERLTFTYKAADETKNQKFHKNSS